MKKIVSVLGLILGVMIFGKSFVHAQNTTKVLVHTEECDQLVLGINNYVTIVAQQEEPVALAQVNAFLFTPNQYNYNLDPIELDIEKEGDLFKIRPDSIGTVDFKIKIGNIVETTRVYVKPLEAVCRLSNFYANRQDTIPLATFKEQEGIIANVTCCGFDAKCLVLEYEVLRFGRRGRNQKVKNVGARFEEATQKLIEKAKIKDIYMFRNIYYRCPSAIEKQHHTDLIFEIK